jgi:tryptophan synthase beta chain
MAPAVETTVQLNSYRTGPDERGHFGIYGGRFVAETLMPLILDLEAAYSEAILKQFNTILIITKIILIKPKI